MKTAEETAITGVGGIAARRQGKNYLETLSWLSASFPLPLVLRQNTALFVSLLKFLLRTALIGYNTYADTPEQGNLPEAPGESCIFLVMAHQVSLLTAPPVIDSDANVRPVERSSVILMEVP